MSCDSDASTVLNKLLNYGMGAIARFCVSTYYTAICVCKKRTRCLPVLIISGLAYLRYLKCVILYFRLNLNNRILFVFSSEE